MCSIHKLSALFLAMVCGIPRDVMSTDCYSHTQWNQCYNDPDCTWNDWDGLMNQTCDESHCYPSHTTESCEAENGCVWTDDGCVTSAYFCNNALENECAINPLCSWYNPDPDSVYNSGMCYAACGEFAAENTCVWSGNGCGWDEGSNTCVECEGLSTSDDCIQHINCGWNGHAEKKCIACAGDYSGNCSGIGGFYGCGVNYDADKDACRSCESLPTSWCNSSWRYDTQAVSGTSYIYTGNNITCFPIGDDCFGNSPSYVDFNSKYAKSVETSNSRVKRSTDAQNTTSHDRISKLLAEHKNAILKSIDDDSNKKLGQGIGIGIGISIGVFFLVWIIYKSDVIKNFSTSSNAYTPANTFDAAM